MRENAAATRLRGRARSDPMLQNADQDRLAFVSQSRRDKSLSALTGCDSNPEHPHPVRATWLTGSHSPSDERMAAHRSTSRPRSSLSDYLSRGRAGAVVVQPPSTSTAACIATASPPPRLQGCGRKTVPLRTAHGDERGIIVPSASLPCLDAMPVHTRPSRAGHRRRSAAPRAFPQLPRRAPRIHRRCEPTG